MGREPAKRRVYGYSLGLETLMWLIKKGETETSKFRYMLEYYRLTEDQAWQIYEAWCELKVHPLVKSVNQLIHGVTEG